VVSVENCYECANCVQKGNEYTCDYKHIIMGKKPYYEKEIPQDHIYNYGFRVCQFVQKQKQFDPLEW
jgi:hypothetical protein